MDKIIETILKHKQKELTSLIAIDIAGAFDNAWWPAIIKRMDNDDVPSDLIRIIKSYLNNEREVKFTYESETFYKKLTKGCPQGGPLSPLLWNILLNDLLINFDSMNADIICYADDVTIICWNKTIEGLKTASEYTLNYVIQWCNRNKLTISTEKTNMLYLHNRQKIPIKVNNNIIMPVKQVKILGMKFSNHKWKNKVNFTPHVNDILCKAGRMKNLLCSLSGNMWGLDTEKRLTLFKTIIRPVLTYGSEIWFKYLNNRCKQKLNSMQHQIILWAVRAYKTTSSNCVHSLAKIPLLTDYIESRKIKFDLAQMSIEDLTTYEPHAPSIVKSFLHAKMNEIFENTNEIFRSFFVLGIPRFFRPNFYNIQFITDHGNFGKFLATIGAVKEPGCFCGGEIQDARHLLLECPIFRDFRENRFGRIGQLDEFVDKKENTFFERLEQFLILEDASEDKKKAYLLTLIRAKAYEVLKNLCSPELPKNKTFEELTEKLNTHFSPKRSIIVQRFIFFKRMQETEESVSQYLVAIKRLAATCEFGNFLEDSLRDKFVCGLSDSRIQKKILSEGDVSLARVMEIALSMEAAEQNIKLFHAGELDKSVDKLRIEMQRESKNGKRKCKHCGNLHRDSCRFKDVVCFKCRKKGHIAPVCRNQEVYPIREQASQQNRIHQMDDQGETEELIQKITCMRTPHDYRINTTTSDPPYIIRLKVENNFIDFELDTGSCLTLISENDFKKYLPNAQLKTIGMIIKTYDGTVVPILGEVIVKVEFQGKTSMLRAVVVKGEKKALVGREWINLLKIDYFAMNQIPSEIAIAEFLKEHQVLFNDTAEPIKGFTFSMNIRDVSPIFHKARPVPFAIRTAVTEALENMVTKGYLYRVTLNRFLDTAAYPLPTQQDLFAILAKGKYFSKLDLSSAYLQLEVATSTQPFLTINTHKGLFRFRRMPFGLANAPSYFQSVMDRVLAGIEGVICYIDDVLIATVSVEKHLAVLKTVFLRLEKYNIKLKKDKCIFVQREIEYLGHLIKEDGIRPLDHKVQALQKAKSPTNISELRSFLGLVNYYGKFIPNLSDLLRPLHELLHKKNCWSWTKECEEAIEKCKSSITSERVLVPYDTTLPLFLATDASQIGIGAVLSHVIGGQERPIMFASRTLSGAERNYSQIEREALAIIYGVTKFHQFIYGRRFTLITDHKPLVSILGPKSGIPTLSTSRLQRWAIILSAYTYDIKFKKTQDHGNADLLSRLPVESEETSRLDNIYALSYMEDLPITAEEIRIETQKDEVLSIVKCYTQHGWPERVPDHLRPYFQRKLELTVDGECLLWGMRVIIPSSLRPNLLSCLHETHSGMSKMKSVARSHFWWPNLDNEIEFLVNRCRNCQQVRDGPNRVKWQPWIWAVRPWQRIHIDYANKDNINLLIVVDSHSKWVEAFPMREITSAKTIEQLRRLFSSYGLPEEIVSDNGPQLTGHAIKILLAYRSTPHETTKKAPSELFIGRSLRTRLSIIHPNLESIVKEQQARQMKYDHGFQQDEFGIDDMVWCRNFRGGDRWIPGRIVGRKGSRVYTVLIHGQVKSYHRDQIRKRWENGGDEDRQYGRQREETDIIVPEADMPNRGRSESPPIETARQQRDSGLVDQNDGGISGESSLSPDPEARIYTEQWGPAVWSGLWWWVTGTRTYSTGYCCYSVISSAAAMFSQERSPIREMEDLETLLHERAVHFTLGESPGSEGRIPPDSPDLLDRLESVEEEESPCAAEDTKPMNHLDQSRLYIQQYHSMRFAPERLSGTWDPPRHPPPPEPKATVSEDSSEEGYHSMEESRKSPRKISGLTQLIQGSRQCSPMGVGDLGFFRVEEEQTVTDPSVSMGWSLMAGVSDHLLPDFSLQAVLGPVALADLQAQLHHALDNQIIGEPAQEALFIVANIDQWKVEVFRCSKTSPELSTAPQPVMAPLVTRMCEDFLQMFLHHIHSDICLMHLEDCLQEMFYLSQCVDSGLLDCGDLPLLSAVAEAFSSPSQ
ncbi:K02A2.6-like [Cordylochernes scorpioides]|uniref:RNA-directed DNA polymerase n=1 Tax=Cordylochernes scorpioides TaxID=51811 RepID=A0ABY6L9R7_9ARAC|nr:K02A2.6-like [Cordylochernes scorpioides]